MPTTDPVTYMDGIANQKQLYTEGKRLASQLENLLERVNTGRTSIQDSIDTDDGVYSTDDLANAGTLMTEVNDRLKAVSAAIDTALGD